MRWIARTSPSKVGSQVKTIPSKVVSQTSLASCVVTAPSSVGMSNVTGTGSVWMGLMSSTARLRVSVLLLTNIIIIYLFSLVTPCPANQFQCSSGECIPLQERCDGQYQCLDGSDEACGCQDYCTGTREFKCRDNLCVQMVDSSPKCDGISQCPDGSDEMFCPGVISPPNLSVCNPLSSSAVSW